MVVSKKRDLSNYLWQPVTCKYSGADPQRTSVVGGEKSAISCDAHDGPGERVSGVSGAGARATRLLTASDNNCVEVGAGVESIFNLRVVNSCVLLALGQVRGPGGQAVREKNNENREKRKVSNWWLNPVTQKASNRNWLFQEKGVVINGG